MRTNFLIFILFLIVTSCKKSSSVSEKNLFAISERVSFQEDGKNLKLKSGRFTYNIPKSRLPYKRVMLLNSSLLGYFTALGKEEVIVGVSSPEYIYSEKVNALLRSGNIQNIGDESRYNTEKILAMKPDALFTNYIPTFENTYDLLKKRGIEIIFLDEYMEQKPLEKTAYLLVFGKLLGIEERSEALYKQIVNSYDSIKHVASAAKERPMVLSNEMYGNQWFMPGGATSLSHYVRDAGAQYILEGDSETRAIPMSFEEVFVKAEKANYWINAGMHHSKGSLLAVNPNYAKMKVFQKGTVYTLMKRNKNKSNDFFESGAVRADWVLKDYAAAFHPELFPEHEFVYLKAIQ